MIDLSINMIVQNNENTIKNALENIKNVADEIVIVDGGSTDNTVNICQEYTDKIFYRKFDNDFSEQKNFANSKCDGRWIFNIDSDEIMSNILKENLRGIIKANEHADLIIIPRLNIVNDITDEYINKWGWVKDSNDNSINWPDYQDRLYKNSPSIRWAKKVHERLAGYKSYGKVPADKSFGMYLIHIKDIEKQIKQNEFYNRLF